MMGSGGVKQRILFIAGLHRSGTSILHRGIRQHPQISGFYNTGVPEDEGQHLQTVFPTARQLGGPGRFAFHRRAHLTETSALVTAENRDRLIREWGNYWDFSKPVLVEKSPKNLVQMRFLQALFPESYFLVILRHPAVVAMATRKWAKRRPLIYLIRHWLHAHRLLMEDLPHLVHCRIIYYEDFVLNPKDHFLRIFQWIEVEPFHPETEVRNANTGYLEQWKELSAWYRKWIKHRYEHAARALGYSFEDLSRAIRPSLNLDRYRL